MQYLVSFVGYDASEDMWLAESQLEHAQELSACSGLMACSHGNCGAWDTEFPPLVTLPWLVHMECKACQDGLLMMYTWTAYPHLGIGMC